MAQPGGPGLPPVAAAPHVQHFQQAGGYMGQLIHNHIAAQVPAGLQQAVVQGVQQALPPLLAPHQLALQQVQQTLQQVEQTLQQVEQTVQQVEQTVLTLMHRTSPALRLALQYNGRSHPGDGLLRPVPNPDTGAQPPFFPATNDALDALSYAQLGTLLAFYGQPLGGNRQARIRRLKAFIGQVHEVVAEMLSFYEHHAAPISAAAAQQQLGLLGLPPLPPPQAQSQAAPQQQARRPAAQQQQR